MRLKALQDAQHPIIRQALQSGAPEAIQGASTETAGVTWPCRGAAGDGAPSPVCP